MEFAISNIAWEPNEDDSVREVLTSAGFRAIEVAPTKTWPDPSAVTAAEALRFRDDWESHGFRLVAMQALLFGHPEMTLFEDAARRTLTYNYLLKLMELAARLGVKPLVFGSPKNRLAGTLPKPEALVIAADFFHGVGRAAARLGVEMCIEPNPPQYGCDFVNTISEAVELVRAAGSPGFRLHVDGSALILNGEDIEVALDHGYPFLSHFHISEPFLTMPGSHETLHRRMALQLRKLGYAGFASIEMRGGQLADNIQAVRQAVDFATRVYGVD
jgi:D-psicose/D-tagatose/L-ribulose 3-epimerase